MKGNNNVSRKEFKEFCDRNGIKPDGNSNSFTLLGSTYGFSMPSGSKAECRQFGEHYHGLVCLFPNGNMKWFGRDDLYIGACSRISPNGTRYFSVKEK